MRKLGLVVLVAVAGCGSSGQSGVVDPAALDACLAWANGVCRLAYLCVSPSAQDAAFHARYGTSTDNCWQGLNARCMSNQTGSGAFGPSCGPGKTVSQAALQTCQDTLDSQSCVDWMAAPAGGCENLCGAATSGPDGGRSDTGGGGGSIATQAEFCSTFGNLSCDRNFECNPTGSASTFGTLSGCKGLISFACASGGSTFCPNGYNPTLAQTCIANARAATCAVVNSNAPIAGCDLACMM